jgi:hypothetical protein
MVLTRSSRDVLLEALGEGRIIGSFREPPVRVVLQDVGTDLPGDDGNNPDT